MKKIVSLLLALSIMLSLCACQGNFGSVNLSDSIAIPDDGVIKESIVKQIQSENAIGVRFPTAYEENTEPTIGFYYNAFSLCLSGKFWKCKPE